MSRASESQKRWQNRYDWVAGPDFAKIVEKFQRYDPEDVRVEVRRGLSEKGLPELWFRVVVRGKNGTFAVVEEDDDYSHPCPPFC